MRNVVFFCTGNINASLMTLRSCIEALRENQQDGANVRVSRERGSMSETEVKCQGR